MSAQLDRDHETRPTTDDIEQQLDDLQVSGDARQFVEELVKEIGRVEDGADEAYEIGYRALKRSNEFRDELVAIREEIEDVREENRMLREEVRELEHRTSLLKNMAASTANIVERRAAVLIQTLYNEAAHRKRSNNEQARPRASMDYRKVETALGGGLSREQIYRAMERAEEIVETDGVVTYIKQSRSDAKNTRLELDLSEADRVETDQGFDFSPTTEFDQPGPTL